MYLYTVASLWRMHPIYGLDAMRLFFTLVFPVILIGTVVILIRGLAPPDSIRLATGINGGGYWEIGERYKSKLVRDGIAVELVETAGSVENIEKLVAGEVDVAIVQGGLDIPRDHDLQSLGAIFPEPLVIFRHTSAPIGSYPGQWKGIRLAAGGEGSGTRAAARALIKTADLEDTGIELVEAGGSEAIEALHTKEADALLFVSPLDANYLTDAILDPDIVFVQMALVDALALRFPGANSALLPAGSVTLDPPRPPEEVKIMTLTASMIATGGVHPAVADRLAHAATKIHSDRTILRASREFPHTNSPPAPLNDVSWQFISSGPNILHDIFPFWIAAQFGRVLLFLLPLVFLAPLLRAIPSLYVWYQKRRVWRHYQRIEALETAFALSKDSDEIEAVSRELDEVALSLANLRLPLAYRQSAYDARLHIDHIRQEIMRRGS